MTMPGFTTKDVVFHTPPQGPLEATLYLPEGDGPFPAVVSVHGGGWSGETRRANVIFDQAMAAAGIVVMAVDFRMPPACRYPVSVGDINLAIRWLKLEAPVLDIVPGLVGGFGTSSGGHQIFLNALCPDDPLYAAEELPGGQSVDASLAFVVGCWPVVDPLARYRMVVERNNESLVARHHAFWPDEAAMADGNPQMILERGAAAHLPPALVIQGTADQSLTPDMASRFAAAYHAAGGALELVIFDGQPHSFVAQAPDAEDSKRAIETVIRFVKRQAKEEVLF
jgi:acetyl esterase/lipase